MGYKVNEISIYNLEPWVTWQWLPVEREGASRRFEALPSKV
jgi:hypothetical protein